MDQPKKVIFIHVLNYFIIGIFTVLVPLAMEARNINIVTIGLIFASMPMIFQLSRLAFAVLSDLLGRKVFFVANGFLVVSASIIYYFAYTPLEFLFGKVIEGIQNSALWSVNRAFLMETAKHKWRILIQMRTVTYLSWAVGSLLAGFFITWIFFNGTLLLCALTGIFVIPLSLSLVDIQKQKMKVTKAIDFLDFRKKKPKFKIFLALFFVMGLSFGFRKGFIFPLFLSDNGFDPTLIGIFIGLQTLLAGLSSHIFSSKLELRWALLLSGLLHTTILVTLGVTRLIVAAAFVVVYGLVEGLIGICQEGIYIRITNKESYATDIGLLTLGFQSGITISLAVSGIMISTWGFASVFFSSALIFILFYLTSYTLLKDQ